MHAVNTCTMEEMDEVCSNREDLSPHEVCVTTMFPLCFYLQLHLLREENVLAVNLEVRHHFG